MVRNFVFSRSGAGDHEQTLKFPCVSNVSFLLPPKRLARVPEKLLANGTAVTLDARRRTPRIMVVGANRREHHGVRRQQRLQRTFYGRA
jgi:hypothetical protein